MMKKFKILFMAFATFLLVGVAGVSAEESNAFQNLTSDGNITVPVLNVNETDRAHFLIKYLETFNTDDYSFSLASCDETYNNCNVGVIYNDGSETEYYDVVVSYEETYSEDFKRLTSDGNLTIDTKDIIAIGDWLEAYIISFNTTDFQFQLNGCNEDYSICNVMGISSDAIVYEQHAIDITYNEVYSDSFKRVLTNGVVNVPIMNFDSKDLVIDEYFQTLRTTDYYFSRVSCEDDYSKCVIGLANNSNGVRIEQHEVKMKYIETYSEKFKSLLTDGSFVVKQSTISPMKYEILSNAIGEISTDNYSIQYEDCNSDFTVCTISANDSTTMTVEQHKVNIKYVDEYSEKFKKLTSNGTIKITSSTVGEKNHLVWDHVSNYDNSEVYFGVPMCNDDYTKCDVRMSDYQTGKSEMHTVNIVYEEKISSAFDNVIVNGNFVIPSIQPKNLEESDFFLQNYLNTISNGTYEYSQGGCNDDSTVCDIMVYMLGEDGSYTSERHKANIIYSDVDPVKATQVNNVLASIPNGTKFTVEDLEFINYIVNSGFTDDRLYYSSESAVINYSTELKKLLGNSNITASLDIRGGGMSIFSNGIIGGYVVSYDGVAYGLFHGGAIVNYVVYIPDNIEESQAAYIKAAKARIDSYLGKNNLEIMYAGKLSELDFSDHNELGYTDLKDEFYTITVNDMIIPILIIKDSAKMQTIGEQTTSDVLTNVSISMNSSKVPLDASIQVNEISKESQEYTDITNKLSSYNTNNALVYDLKLYSASNKDYITKLDNGLFEVKIPVSKELEGKDLIVYYVNEDGKVDEHEVTPKDGYAIFTTNHFSIYTLAEKGTAAPGIENPNTFDGITTYFMLAIISVIGLVISGLCSIKFNTRKDY